MLQNPYHAAQLRHYANPQRALGQPYPVELRAYFSHAASRRAHAEIATWRGYAPTRLVNLDEFAADFGVAAVYYKDESSRFGLGSFKALGGAYAVLRLLQKILGSAEQRGKRGKETISARDLERGKFADATAAITVVTATDGNHGRSVAWGAARFGCRCRIYIHAAVSEARAAAMRELGAKVVRVAGNYDDSVRQAATDAEARGWYVVSDTSYPGYRELPAQVMAGYTVMLEEIFDPHAPQLAPETPPTHVFVQGGVGGLAAAMAAWLWEKFAAARPRFIVVEPHFADCLLSSAKNQRITEIRVTQESIMAGLSCGEVSELAWQVLGHGCDDFLSIHDDPVAPLMAMLAQNTPSIEAGESAVAGLVGCGAACQNAVLKAKLGLDAQSRVLVLGTEGATDREIYAAIIAECGGYGTKN